ncbi:hypothetical protein ACFFJN_05865 [Erwinia mallotivora]|uniref:hypothetical protein n=1 Tax=Erwinia mallotivora TaxID=69222 RepID=UPI0035ECCC63
MNSVSANNAYIPGDIRNINSLNNTEQAEKTEKSGFCSRLLSCLVSVKNTILRFVPCLRSKEVWAEKKREDNKKTYDFIEKTLLDKVKNNNVDGIFRAQINSKIAGEIKNKPLGYNTVKHLISGKDENAGYILSQILLADVRKVEKQINVTEMLRLLNPGVKHDSQSIRNFVMERISFKSDQEKERFLTSMRIIADIYTEVGKRPCSDCTPYTLAQAIAPSIFDCATLRPGKTVTDPENIRHYANLSPKAGLIVLQSWNPKN